MHACIHRIVPTHTYRGVALGDGGEVEAEGPQPALGDVQGPVRTQELEGAGCWLLWCDVVGWMSSE